MKKGKFIYYDPDYNIGKPDSKGSWITSEVSKQILDFLKGRGFERLNAANLRKKMLSVVKRWEEEEEKIFVIVFAQDVAPDTVLDHTSPTALVRQYLDNGGSIIWVGDIPFYYQARVKGFENWEQNGAPANILGVNPVFPLHIPKTKITKAGEALGLKSAWTGIRPVLIDKTIKVLAETECPVGSPYQPIPSSWLSRQWDRLTGISLGVSTLRFGVEKTAPAQEEAKLPKKALLKKRLANAWFKNYDAARLCSGFFRIWDYSPAVLTKQQLGELCEIALKAGGKGDTE